MNRKLILCILIIFTSISIFGCRTKEKNSTDKDSVLIYKMNAETWEKDSDKPILEIKDKEGIELFKNLLENATKVDGLLDMAPPSYIAEVKLIDKITKGN